MKDAIVVFFNEKRAETNAERCETLQKVVESSEFWEVIAFLADTFHVFNICNKKMQAPNVNLFMVRYVELLFDLFLFVQYFFYFI